ncbi:MAG: hypothetical protein OXC30_03380 [Alphaproteobacteria bacterium]|nr:hypothetical protein [Alphaproteobacteria bacterium]
MTLILLFCAFLQSYAAQQSSNADFRDYLPEDELQSLRAFKTITTYTPLKLHQLAKSAHMLLKNIHNISEGEQSLYIMDPKDQEFCFSAALLCQAFALTNKGYESTSRIWRGNDKWIQEYSSSHPHLISSALDLLNCRNSLARQQYTKWYSMVYDDDLYLTLDKNVGEHSTF